MEDVQFYAKDEDVMSSENKKEQDGLKSKHDLIYKRKLNLGLMITIPFVLIYYVYFLPLIFGGGWFTEAVSAATTVFMAIVVILSGMFAVLLYHFKATRMEGS